MKYPKHEHIYADGPVDIPAKISCEADLQQFSLWLAQTLREVILEQTTAIAADAVQLVTDWKPKAGANKRPSVAFLQFLVYSIVLQLCAEALHTQNEDHAVALLIELANKYTPATTGPNGEPN